MMSTPNYRRGITILEATVVSGLLAVLAVMLSSAWVGVGRTAVDLIGRSQLVQERDLAIAALSRDLGGSLGLSNSGRSGGKEKGRWLKWDKPANAEQPLDSDLRLLYDGRTSPDDPVFWATPNTIIRYIVESGALVRWDELANTKFIVATNVSSMKVEGITGRPDALNIEIVFKYRKLALTCNLTAEIP